MYHRCQILPCSSCLCMPGCLGPIAPSCPSFQSLLPFLGCLYSPDSPIHWSVFWGDIPAGGTLSHLGLSHGSILFLASPHDHTWLIKPPSASESQSALPQAVRAQSHIHTAGRAKLAEKTALTMPSCGRPQPAERLIVSSVADTHCPSREDWGAVEGKPWPVSPSCSLIYQLSGVPCVFTAEQNISPIRFQKHLPVLIFSGSLLNLFGSFCSLGSDLPKATWLDTTKIHLGFKASASPTDSYLSFFN